jgi:hypothetical protein
LRSEYSWVRPDATTLIQRSNGEIQWWTFAGSLANLEFRQRLGLGRPDNCCIRGLGNDLSEAEARIHSISLEESAVAPHNEAIKNLKFSDCLSDSLANEVYWARSTDPAAVHCLKERIHVTKTF